MKIILIILGLLSFDIFANCPLEFSEAGLCAELTWVDGPHDGKNSEFILNFWPMGDSGQQLLSPEYDVKLFSWMTMANGMNHGGPAFHYTETVPGSFEVKDARFFMHGMKGYWEIKIELYDGEVLISSQAERVELHGQHN